MPEVRVMALGVDPQGSRPLLVLQETDGRGRVLPIAVGVPEAQAVELERSGARPERPQTHALICDVVEALGHRIDGVRITELREGIYHAELRLDGGVTVSSRLTDAVTLALHLGLPIMVEEEVLVAGASEIAVVDVEDDEELEVVVDESGEPVVDPDEVEAFRKFLDQASPEDFDKPS
ncbi:MAG: bifunctional nuclease family protein [Pseudonocardia sp.]|nr:bifunctional nuclease family protein [Pseudonocardia sp.]